MVRRNICGLGALLTDRAMREPSKIGYTFLSDSLDPVAQWSYSSLDLRARAVAAHVREKCRQGSRVLLLFPTGDAFIGAFFGCLYANVVPVPLEIPRREESKCQLGSIIRDSQPDLAMTTAEALSELRKAHSWESNLGMTQWITTEAIQTEDCADFEPNENQPDSLAYLQYTSGSTTFPKGVMISHENVFANMEAIDADFLHDDESLSVNWLPHFHDMGLVYGLLQPIFNGFPVVSMSPATFIRRPMNWLDAMTKYQGTHSGGPNFSYELCVDRTRAGERDRLDLRKWRVAFNAAEIVRRRTLLRFAEAFETYGFRSKAFYVAYGLAEATLKVTGTQFEEVNYRRPMNGILENSDRSSEMEDPVSCGRPALGTEVRIIDPNTHHEVPAGDAGEIWVRGKSVALGYWNRHEETGSTFGASITRPLAEGYTTSRRFLRTGDLGYLADSGLVISGRLKDVVIIRGRNHCAEDLEQTVQDSHYSLGGQKGAAFSINMRTSEELAIIQEVKRTFRRKIDTIEALVRACVLRRHGLRIDHLWLVRPGSIPITSSGKVRRSACKDAFLAGALDQALLNQRNTVPDRHIDSLEEDFRCPDRFPVNSQVVSAAEEAVREIFLSLFKRSITSDDLSVPFSSLGLDSIDVMQLSHRLSRFMNCEVPFQEIVGGSPSDLIDLIGRDVRENEGRQDLSAPISSQIRAFEGLQTTVEQERLWLLQHLKPQTAAYNIMVGMRTKKSVNLASFHRALNWVCESHELLQVQFYRTPYGIFMRRVPRRPLSLPVLEVDRTTVSPRAALNGWLATIANQPFDLSAGPLLRVVLIRVSTVETVCVLAIHHIISDMWSVKVLLDDVLRNYSLVQAGKLTSVRTIDRAYRSFVLRTREQLRGPAADAAFSYWHARLAGIPSAPLFEARRQAVEATPISRSVEMRYEFPGNVLIMLHDVSRVLGVTPFIVLLTAYCLALYALTHRADFVIAVPVANRDQPEFGTTIGLFASPLMLRVRIDKSKTARELLYAVRDTFLEGLKYNSISLAKIVRSATADRHRDQLPLAQALFSYDRALDLDGGLDIEVFEIPGVDSDFDIMLAVRNRHPGLYGILRYRTGIFDQTTAEKLLKSYLDILSNLTAKSWQLENIFT